MIKILCTVGPSTLDKASLKKLEREGVTLFRINLSHTRIEELSSIIETIQNNVRTPICIDTEGAQIRTGSFTDNYIILNDNEKIVLVPDSKTKKNNLVKIKPYCALSFFEKGDLAYLDFNSVIVQVIKTGKEKVDCRVIQGGKVGSNKAVNLNRKVFLKPLTGKDIKSVEIAKNYGIDHFALSFAQCRKDVTYFRKIIGDKAYLISKIESNLGLKNLGGIIESSDAILIDRGDLSREQPIERIPLWQKVITEKVLLKNKELFIATNLLETMIENKDPTRAELSDVINSLFDSVSGLVLAAETAIGKNPIQCVRVIKSAINEFLDYRLNHTLKIEKKNSNLIKPHGGELKIANLLIHDEYSSCYSLEISYEQFLDFYQIVTGGYSPINGFMSSDDINSILHDNRLINSTVWTLPIILQVNKNDFENVGFDETIRLCFKEKPIGCLKLKEKFILDIDNYCHAIYGLNDENHPGVKMVKLGGKYIFSGKVSIFNNINNFLNHVYLSPKEARDVMDLKQWQTVVGFHTRNIPHNGHLYIQKKAYDQIHADGIFISPITGMLKRYDFSIEDIINCYNLLIEKSFYGNREILFNLIQYYPRFAGPREAIMTALIRQNYGCSHFIIGRDHAGIGNKYKSRGAKDSFKRLIEYIQIKLLFFDEVYYCKACKTVTDKCDHEIMKRLSISGSQVRFLLKNNYKFEYPIINENILEYLKESR